MTLNLLFNLNLLKTLSRTSTGLVVQPGQANQEPASLSTIVGQSIWLKKLKMKQAFSSNVLIFQAKMKSEMPKETTKVKNLLR